MYFFKDSVTVYVNQVNTGNAVSSLRMSPDSDLSIFSPAGFQIGECRCCSLFIL